MGTVSLSVMRAYRLMLKSKSIVGTSLSLQILAEVKAERNIIVRPLMCGSLPYGSVQPKRDLHHHTLTHISVDS
jgi:hypothetical protein